MLTLNLIGKESNRLDETIAGLLGMLDDTFAAYHSPTENTWTNLVRPALDDFPNRNLAALAGLDTRTLQRIKSRAITTPHERNRALLTLVTAQLAANQLESWGITPPTGPFERIAVYLDHHSDHETTRVCVSCGEELTGRQRSYCSDSCRKRAYRTRRVETRTRRAAPTRECAVFSDRDKAASFEAAVLTAECVGHSEHPKLIPYRRSGHRRTRKTRGRCEVDGLVDVDT
jgi:hypothetical protein